MAWDVPRPIGLPSPFSSLSLLRGRRLGWVGWGRRKLPGRCRPWLTPRSGAMLRAFGAVWGSRVGGVWELSASRVLNEIRDLMKSLKSQYLWKSFPESLLIQQFP